MPDPTLSRRTVIVGGAVALGATGCAGGPADPAAAGTVLGPTSDVPVGSAKIFNAQDVVVTQAAAGTFAGFSTICPHQGCSVARVQGASIICPCHGSEFGLDGAVTQGPAQRGLTPRAVTVTGTEITLA
jgi:Rieske Fe-S protein